MITRKVFEYWQNDLERIGRNHTYYPDRANKTDWITTNYRGRRQIDVKISRFFAVIFYSWRLDHLLFCLQTPSSLTDKYTNSEPCLSSSGTLVFPYLAIGGYQNEQYTQGKALILTFVIKNHEDRDSEEFKNALRWEEEFLKLVKAESEKLEFWDLAFYSERNRFQNLTQKQRCTDSDKLVTVTLENFETCDKLVTWQTSY